MAPRGPKKPQDGQRCAGDLAKRVPTEPKMGLRWPPEGPRGAPFGAKNAFLSRRNVHFRKDDSKMVQRWVNMAQGGPKRAPRRPTMAPRRPQDLPKAPRDSKRDPTWLKNCAPIEAKRSFSQSWFHECPKKAEHGSRLTQDEPKRANNLRDVPRWSLFRCKQNLFFICITSFRAYNRVG